MFEATEKERDRNLRTRVTYERTHSHYISKLRVTQVILNSLIIVLLQVAIIWPFLVANKMKTAYTQISCPKFEPPTECSLTVTESSKKERRKNKGRCCRGKCKRKKPTSDKSKDTVIVIDNISCERKNRSECSTDTSLVAGQDDYIVSTKICFPLPMGTQ